MLTVALLSIVLHQPGIDVIPLGPPPRRWDCQCSWPPAEDVAPRALEFPTGGGVDAMLCYFDYWDCVDAARRDYERLAVGRADCWTVLQVAMATVRRVRQCEDRYRDCMREVAR